MDGRDAWCMGGWNWAADTCLVETWHFFLYAVQRNSVARVNPHQPPNFAHISVATGFVFTPSGNKIRRGEQIKGYACNSQGPGTMSLCSAFSLLSLAGRSLFCLVISFSWSCGGAVQSHRQLDFVTRQHVRQQVMASSAFFLMRPHVCLSGLSFTAHSTSCM